MAVENTQIGKKRKHVLFRKIQEVVARGGVAIVPAFASGRGQDILRLLYHADPNLRVHYDGMGKRVTRHWMDHPHHITNAEEWIKFGVGHVELVANLIGKRPSMVMLLLQQVGC